MTKALVFDLDDTLLNREKLVCPENREAIRRCIDAGIKIVIATSRPMRAVEKFLDPSLLTASTLITLNGAVLKRRGQTQQISCLGASAKEILEIARNIDGVILSIEYLGAQFSTNQRFSDAELLRYQNTTPDMVIPIEDVQFECISKIAVDGCGKNLRDFVKQISKFRINSIMAVNDSFVNIVEAGVDKSSTLRRFAEDSKINLKDITAFGDDVPDLEMMKVVGHSVAMANSVGDVKMVADTIIGDCDSDSISKYILEHVLGK